MDRLSLYIVRHGTPQHNIHRRLAQVRLLPAPPSWACNPAHTQATCCLHSPSHCCPLSPCAPRATRACWTCSPAWSPASRPLWLASPTDRQAVGTATSHLPSAKLPYLPGLTLCPLPPAPQAELTVLVTTDDEARRAAYQQAAGAGFSAITAGGGTFRGGATKQAIQLKPNT